MEIDKSENLYGTSRKRRIKMRGKENVEEKFKSKILLLIPICIFFSIDGIFSVYSLLPLILLTFIYDCFFSKYMIDKRELYIFLVFSIISILSIITNLVVTPEYFTSQSVIRIVYHIVIIYFYYSMIHVKFTSKYLLRVIYTLIGTGCIISCYFMFVQKIWFVNLLGIQIDKNFVSLFLMLAAVFSLYLFLVRKGKRNIIFLCAFMVLLLGIFFSASRASMLFCLVSCFITIVMYIKQLCRTKLGFVKAIFLLFCIPILLTVVLIQLHSKISNSPIDVSWYWNRYFVNGFGDKSVTGRFLWWKRALEYFASRPIYGYGIGNINVSNNSSAVTHNTYLDFLLDQGIIGFFIFLYFLKNSLYRFFSDKQEMFYGIALCVLLGIFNVSATRSTFLWFSLILLNQISKSEWKDVDEKKKKNKK